MGEFAIGEYKKPDPFCCEAEAGCVVLSSPPNPTWSVSTGFVLTTQLSRSMPNSQ